MNADLVADISTISENQESLPVMIEQAHEEGEVFVLKPERRKGSPFDVTGVDLGVSIEEIVAFVREGRKKP